MANVTTARSELEKSAAVPRYSTGYSRIVNSTLYQATLGAAVANRTGRLILLAAVPLDLLQFHGDESPAACARYGRPWIKAIRVPPDTDLLECAVDFGAARGLLLDAFVPGVPGGTGERFDWSLIPAGLPLPVVLSGGLTPDNVAEAVRRVRPWAVDVSSGVEASKGIKDALKLARFVANAKEAS